MAQEEKYHEFHFTKQGLMEIQGFLYLSMQLFHSFHTPTKPRKCMEFHYISLQNPSCQEIYD